MALQNPVVHRFTVPDYHRMIDAGVFVGSGRMELIEGEIVEMTPIGTRHTAAVNRLTRLFTDALGHRAIVQVQGPVTISSQSEPEPDVALLAPRDDFYVSGKAQPPDVMLIVEVADSSAAYDRGVKRQLYAASGVVEMWLVDLNTDVVEVCTGPGPDGYAHVSPAARGETVAAAAFPDAVLAVDDILG